MGTSIGVAGVFCGCCLNAIFLELLVKGDPGSGTLITFSQFVFIACEGFIFTTNFGQKKRHIPFQSYAVVVAIFFIANVCNNYAFDLNISMPLHMIFRSGSLIANMIMGIIILKRRYTLSKYISVALITLGVIICTVISGKEIKQDTFHTAEDSFFWWLLGILLLIFALFVSARLGIYQEVLFKTFGKHPYEALYYTHLLPLPCFLFLHENIWEHLKMICSSTPITVPIVQLHIPVLLLYLFGNIVTQYICISSVYYLSTETTSFTVTLVLTLRKFASLLISIIYFQNSFTFYHWLGTLFVFIGTIVFTELHNKLFSFLTWTKEKKIQ